MGALRAADDRDVGGGHGRGARRDRARRAVLEIGVTDLRIIGTEPERLPDPAEGARHRLPARQPPLLAALAAPARHHAVIRSEIEQAIHDFFYERGFLRVDTPILTAAIGERSGLFATEYFDEGNAYLAQTGQLYGEAAAAAFGKIYTFGPTFRAEKSKTRRHLTEFWMIEPEVAWNDSEREHAAPGGVRGLPGAARPRAPAGGARGARARRHQARDASRRPSCASTTRDAVALVQRKGSTTQWGDDLGAEDEALIVADYDRPVFVFNYPKEAKAFYMKENPDDPRTVLCDDLLAPEGYGEIIGGSQREDDYDKLVARIKEEGLPMEAYDWYLDLRRYGTFTHSGFGLGLERTVAWICGHAAHPRGDRVPADDAPAAAVAPCRPRRASEREA